MSPVDKHQPDPKTATASMPFFPPPITRIEDTGLSPLWLQDLILKVFYYQGYLTGFKLAEEIALPYVGVVDLLLEVLKREKLVEVKTSQAGLGEGAYQWAITGLGIARAREALERSQYAGPAPVPISVYNESQRKQSRGRVLVTEKIMRQILSSLILSEKTFKRIGPALNSGTSMFLYGPPGNGKTTIARAIGNQVLSQNIYIPYSIYIDGQVVKLYDSVNHQIAPDDEVTYTGTTTLRGVRRDPRWVKIQTAVYRGWR